MPSIFKHSFVKSMHFIPQTATVTPFRASISEYLFQSTMSIALSSKNLIKF